MDETVSAVNPLRSTTSPLIWGRILSSSTMIDTVCLVQLGQVHQLVIAQPRSARPDRLSLRAHLPSTAPAWRLDESNGGNPFSGRVMDRAGYCKHLAALFRGETCYD
jgi:hypothetical protein